MHKKIFLTFNKFSKLSFTERVNLLIKHGLLLEDEASILTHETALKHEVSDHLIENAIGCFPIPLGVAVNFVIDNREYIIPMAIEETSVIAAASKTAKWIREEGEITTKNVSHLAIGQIQLPKVKNSTKLSQIILKNKQQLINQVNDEIAYSMTSRGGGAKDIAVRIVPRGDGFDMLIIHIMVNTCDAMGANIINQICEYLKVPIEELLGEKVGLCILSNLTDEKITEANIVIRHIDAELGTAIEEASLFAELDPYRAATNNKGILNAIDAILLATGNDWRAVEAGMHAYAARKGNYQSLSKWVVKNGDLHGVLRAPIVVGIVGGVTNLHPVARIALNMLNVKNANELARIIAAVGLVQNLGALKALVTTGITKGHMKLHLNNLLMKAGANADEIQILLLQLKKILLKNKHITGHDVSNALKKLRENKG